MLIIKREQRSDEEAAMAETTLAAFEQMKVTHLYMVIWLYQLPEFTYERMHCALIGTGCITRAKACGMRGGGRYSVHVIVTRSEGVP